MEELNTALDNFYHIIINNITPFVAARDKIERKIPMTVLNDFFCFAVKNLATIKGDAVLLKKYLEIQTILVTFLNEIEVGHTHSLLNAQMAYNASCSEKALIQSGLPLSYYNPAGLELAELDHEYRHTGIGYNYPDLVSTNNFTLFVKEPDGLQTKTQIDFDTGILFEVKDLGKLSFFDNWQTLQSIIRTKQGHNADFIFAHIIETDAWYICENKLFETPVHHIFEIVDNQFKPEYT